MSDAKRGSASWRGDSAGGGADKKKKDDEKGGRVFALILAFGALAAAVAGLLWSLGGTDKPAFLPIVVQDYISLFPDVHLTYRDHKSFRANLAELLAIDPDDKEVQEAAQFEERTKKIAGFSSKSPAIFYVSSLAICTKTDGKTAVQLLPGAVGIDDLLKAEKLFPLKKLLDAFQACGVEKKILVLDIMTPIADPRLGVLVDDVAGRTKSEIEAIKDLGGVVLCACSPGETAYASEDLKRSVFGYYFEEGMRGFADHYADAESNRGSGRVMALGLANFVKERVSRWAKENRRRSQTPMVFGSAKDYLLVDSVRRKLGHSMDVASLTVDVLPEQAGAEPGKEAAGKDQHAKDSKDSKDAKKAADDKKPPAGDPAAKPATPPAFEDALPNWIVEFWKLRDDIAAAASKSPASGFSGQLLRQAEGLALVAEKRFRGQSETAQSKPQTLRVDIATPLAKLLASSETSANAAGIPSLGFAMGVAGTTNPAITALRPKLTEAFVKATKEAEGTKTFDERKGKLDKVVEEIKAEMEKVDSLQVANLAIEEAIKPRRPANPASWLFARELIDARNSELKTKETTWLRRVVSWQQTPTGEVWPTELAGRLLKVVCDTERLAMDAAAFRWIEPEAKALAEKVHRVEAEALSPGFVSAEKLSSDLGEAESGLVAAADAREIVARAYQAQDDAFKQLPRYWGYVNHLATGELQDPELELVSAWSAAIVKARELSDALNGETSSERRRTLDLLAGNLRGLMDDLQRKMNLGVEDLINRSRGPVRTLNDPADFLRLEAMLAAPAGTFADRRRLYAAARRFSSRMNLGTINLDRGDDDSASPVRPRPESTNLIRIADAADKRAGILDRLLRLGGYDGPPLVGSEDAVATGLQARAALLEIRKRLATPATDDLNRLRVQRMAWIRLPEFSDVDKELIEALGKEGGIESPVRDIGLAMACNWNYERLRTTLSDAGFFTGDGSDLWGTETLARLFDSQWQVARGRFASKTQQPPAPPAVTVKLSGETPALDKPGAAWRNARIVVEGLTGPAAATPRLQMLAPEGNRFKVQLGEVEPPVNKTASASLYVELNDPRLQQSPPANVVAVDAKGFLLRADVGKFTFHKRIGIEFELKPEIILATNKDEPDKSAVSTIDVPPFGAAGALKLSLLVRNSTRDAQSYEVQVFDDDREIFKTAAPLIVPAGRVGEVRPMKKPVEALKGPLVVKLTDKTGKPESRSFPVGISRQMRIKAGDIDVAFKQSKSADGAPRGDLSDLELTAKNVSEKPLKPPCEIAMELVEPERLIVGPIRKSYLTGPLTVGELTLFARDLQPQPGGSCEMFVKVDGYPRRLVYNLQSSVGNRPIREQLLEPILRFALDAQQPDSSKLVDGRLLAKADKSGTTAVQVTVQAANEPDSARVQLRLLDDNGRQIERPEALPARAAEYKITFDETGSILVAGEVKDPTYAFRIPGSGSLRVEAAYVDKTLAGGKVETKSLVIDSTAPEIADFVSRKSEVRAGEAAELIATGDDPETGIARVYFFVGTPPKPEEKTDPPNLTVGESVPNQPNKYRCTNFYFQTDGEVPVWVGFENRIGMRSFKQAKVRVLPKLSADEKKAMEDKNTKPGSVVGQIASETGGIVNGAKVALLKREKKPGETVESFKDVKRPTESANGGKFEFKEVPPGEYLIQVASRDGVLSGSETVTVESDKEADVGSITIRKKK